MVIICGSYITVKVFNLDVEYAVYVAVLGASVGAFVSYVYLKKKSLPILKIMKRQKLQMKRQKLLIKCL